MEGARGRRAPSAPRGLPTASVAGLVLSMTEEQLAAVRLYTSEEVVAKLGLKPTWLKSWITQDRVPHVRSGADRGVRFTAADIFEIGRMLPEHSVAAGGSAAGGTRARAAVVSQPAFRRGWAAAPRRRAPRVVRGGAVGGRHLRLEPAEGPPTSSPQHLILRSGCHLERTDLDAAAAVTGSLT
jgi:hypothetical protein